MVTVVIPAYNAATTIAQALDSVLRQTWQDLQVIVVDDGSDDETAEVVASYSAPVQCVTKPNEGVAKARNDGIEHAAGEYIALLDADDFWAPRKVERQVELLERRPEVGACFTGAVKVNERLAPIEQLAARSYPDYCEALLLHSMVISASSSLMLRRSLIDETGGFDPSFSQCADWDFSIRLAQSTQIAPVKGTLVHYRSGRGRMSNDIPLLERDTFAVLDKFFSGDRSFPYVRKKRHIYSNHWMILAGSYLEAGVRRDAVRCLMNGLGAYPPNVTRPAGLPWRRVKRATGRWRDKNGRAESTALEDTS